jgi:hypothetical protein
MDRGYGRCRSYRRRHRKLTVGNVLYSLMMLVSIIFLLWFAFSVVEVWVHNDTIHSANPYEYSDFNLFDLMTKEYYSK